MGEYGKHKISATINIIKMLYTKKSFLRVNESNLRVGNVTECGICVKNVNQIFINNVDSTCTCTNEFKCSNKRNLITNRLLDS